MAGEQFGSGGYVTVSTFAAMGTLATTSKVQDAGVFSRELPVADVTPIAQSTGSMLKCVGKVASHDPLTVVSFFDPTAALPTDAEADIVRIMKDDVTDGDVQGKGWVTRYELGEMTHDNVQLITTILTWKGGTVAVGEYPIYTPAAAV